MTARGKIIGFWKWKYFLAAGLALSVLLVWLLMPHDGSKVFDDPARVAGEIARWGRVMEANPSAKTAATILDYALKSQRCELVFATLKEHIYPNAGVEGVADEFIRGSRWYISNSSSEQIFWLEEEVRKMRPEADLNQELAVFYEKVSDEMVVPYGKRLFANWTLSKDARYRYLDAVKREAQKQ